MPELELLLIIQRLLWLLDLLHNISIVDIYFKVAWTFSKEEEVLLITVFHNLSMQNSNLPLPLSKDLNIDDWHETSHYCKMSLLLQNVLLTFLWNLKPHSIVCWEQYILWCVTPVVSLILGLDHPKSRFSKILLKSILVKNINGFMYASFKEAEIRKLGQNLFLICSASTSTPMNNTDKWMCKTIWGQILMNTLLFLGCIFSHS